jgi:hypothetical protein
LPYVSLSWAYYISSIFSSFYLFISQTSSGRVLVPPAAALLATLAVTFPPLRLTESNALLLAIREEKASFSNVAQHLLSLHLFSEPFE